MKKDLDPTVRVIIALSFVASSCVPKSGNTTAETISPPTFIPTRESTATPMIIYPTEILPTARPTVEQRFVIGGINFATTPFILEAPGSLQIALGHVIHIPHIYTADFPLPVTGLEFNNDVFNAGGEDNSSGNPYFVILTDRANHLFLNFHSLQRSAPGDFAREVDGFLFKNPEESENIIGSYVNITIEGRDLPAEIVNSVTISESLINTFDGNSPWGFYLGNLSYIFANTKIFGIPDAIRNDTTPGVIYLTFIGCQNVNPGNVSINKDHPSEAYAENTANRSLVTLRIVIPQ